MIFFYYQVITCDIYSGIDVQRWVCVHPGVTMPIHASSRIIQTRPLSKMQEKIYINGCFEADLAKLGFIGF